MEPLEDVKMSGPAVSVLEQEVLVEHYCEAPEKHDRIASHRQPEVKTCCECSSWFRP